MKELNPYVNFNGQCEAAFKFYAKCLGGKITYIGTYAGSPMEDQVPKKWRQKIMHATLTFGDEALMGCDAPPGRYDSPKGISLSLGFKKPTDGKRVFKALSKGGTIVMPFQKTFWSPGFGMFRDRYDVPWMINCHQDSPKA